MSAGSILGHPVRRLEDPDLLTGRADFVGDLLPVGTLHAAFVRSTMPHGRMLAIDLAEAAAAPGVVGAFTAADLGLPRVNAFFLIPADFDRPPLATDTVRYVGDPLAVVVADDPQAAADAVDAIMVDLDPLPPVVDPVAALDDASPRVFADTASNLVTEYSHSPGAALDGHDLVVEGRFVNQRVAGVPIEPSAVLAEPSAAGVTVWCTTQNPHAVRSALAGALGLTDESVRVIAPAVGGGFGPKAVVYPEFVVVAALARRLGRPVAWIETRSENLVNMVHGRGQHQRYRAGVRADGTVAWLDGEVVADAGAYPAIGAFLPALTQLMATGPYRIPVVGFRARTATTNTTPTGAFRGAGRPEATAALERMMDLIARRLDLDPAEVRRRNLLGPAEFPLTTPTGAAMDCGAYAAALDAALDAAGYADLRAEQARRRAAGDQPLLGIGVSTYVEVTAGDLYQEYGAVAIEHDGTATVRVGTSAHGQGHVTAFTQIVTSLLGIGADAVRIVQSDTAEVPRGMGTAASRSLQTAGSAVHVTATEVRARARKVAAHLLEASADDIVVDDGGLAVAGVPTRTLSWAELAAAVAAGLPAEVGVDSLAAEVDFDQGGATFPFGAHVAVVEVDRDTGATELVRHVAIDDCGRILNPMLAEGQVHGGIAQGVAQALYEHVVYDPTGVPLTASLVDYAIPGATELPSFETGHTETPTPLNPARREGHRRVGHDRVDTCGAVRGHRRCRSPRRRAPRHAAHPRAGVAGDQRRRRAGSVSAGGR